MKLSLTFLLAIMTAANCMASDCRLYIQQQSEWHAGQIISHISKTALESRQLVEASVHDTNNEMYDLYVEVETKIDSKGTLFAILNMYSKISFAPIFSTSVAVTDDAYKVAADQLISNTLSCELLKELELQNLKYPLYTQGTK